MDVRRRKWLIGAACAAALGSVPAAHAQAGELADQVARLQQAWATVEYRTPASAQETGFEDLARQARELVARHPGQAEPHVMLGIALGYWAGAKGGLPAFDLVKQAKAEFDTAIGIDRSALGGAALYHLGELYYRVPGWPIGFGDRAKAEALMKQALEIDPSGIEPNYYYAGYLADGKRDAEALRYLARALQAPPMPGQAMADAGRRDDVRAMMARLRSGARKPPD